ncbi:MAG: hypothetical protein M9964_09655 [Solirubrobacterales bacterium]|nr:hypothetical protein [Solirubrobacterales bacterium]
MHEEEQAPPPQEAAPASIGPEGAAAPEISRRVGSILDAVEREAARLREEARVEAGAYLDNARRRADGLVAERQRRIGEISDELIAKSEAVIARLDDAAPVRMGFENLVRALGDAAERLAREAEGTAADFEPPPFGATAAQPYVPAQPVAQPPQHAQAPHPQPLYQPPQPQHPHSAQPLVHHPPQQHQEAQPAQQPAYEPAPHPARSPVAPGWRGGVPAAGGAPAPAGGGVRGGAPHGDEARMAAIQMAASGATRGAVREHLQRTLGLADPVPVLDEVFGPGSGEDAQVPWTAGPR